MQVGGRILSQDLDHRWARRTPIEYRRSSRCSITRYHGPFANSADDQHDVDTQSPAHVCAGERNRALSCTHSNRATIIASF
ncbi:unnamed protein product (plasmid) [Mycetohabitans rhizoxinica HKI 454]|uniref:Uncharacterized protein n=1 Tax=Mycetohabitans rhizoxinica (strain DSM 19002 / CIP 109453 / HKI 454) TaxID=882378 RepID=E5ATR2_MYCRK|nr:unnamed protein product [Mycetohabitans rhizoxinica HKI 454]